METQNLFRMYFGRNIGGDNRVVGFEVNDFIEKYIAPVFPGFTAYQGIGYWYGKSEDCFIVEIISNRILGAVIEIRSICKAYNNLFDQDAVLITRQPVDMELVTER